MKTREESLALLHEYTLSESLRKHCYAVEACMRWYAKHYNQDEAAVEQWGITGLLHDFDYEQHQGATPPDGHPYFGCALLKDLGYCDEIVAAIMGHALYTGVPTETLMAKTLFAVDELSGLVTATSLVRPDKSFQNLEVSSVLKRMKEKSFAKGCNREDIRQGATELGIALEEHTRNVITALRELELSNK